MFINTCAGRIEFVDLYDFVGEISVDKIDVKRGHEYVVQGPYEEVFFKRKAVKSKGLSRKTSVAGISNKLDEARLRVFLSEELIKFVSSRRIDLEVLDLGIAELEDIAVLSAQDFGNPTHGFFTSSSLGTLFVVANPEDFKVFLGSLDGKDKASLTSMTPHRVKICLFQNFVVEDQLKRMERPNGY